MNSIKILRVENNKGHGPYHNGYYVMWESDNKEGFKPELSTDQLIAKELNTRGDLIQNYLFGFLNIAQFESWFNKEEKENLLKAGFFLQEYVLPLEDVIIGEHQIVFRRKKANSAFSSK